LAGTSDGAIESYDGTSWSESVVVDPSRGFDTDLITSLSCAAKDFCAATDDGGEALVFGGTLTTTTSVTSPTTRLVVGERFSVSAHVNGVDSSSEITPTGDVVISDGSQSCDASLVAGSGGATGSCDLTEVRAKEFSLRGTYSGDPLFSPSSSSVAASVDVGKATSYTVLKVSPARVHVGNERAAVISVHVSTKYSSTAISGQVTVSADHVTWCVVRLARGVGTCHLGVRSLALGAHHLVASYLGGANFTPSTSATVSIDVTN
jgi:hypothetical protein